MTNFDQVFNRKDTYSIKWDGAGDAYKNPDVIPMWIADMDFKAPEAVVKAVTKQAEVGIYGYATPSENYSKYVADWLKERNGWQVDENLIGYTTRVVDALSLAVRALTKENDAIIVQTPLYHFFEAVITNAKRNVVYNPLVNENGRYSLDFADFEKKIIENDVKLYILCNPHNPTGRVWTVDELQQIIEICKKHDVLIISDDIHSDLIMKGHEYTPLAKIAGDYADKIVTTKSPSKAFNMAGLQLGYFTTSNKEIFDAIEAEKTYCTYVDLPNNFAIAGMIAAYTEGATWLEEVNDYILSNFNHLKGVLNKKVPKTIVTELEATYLAWIDVSYLNVSEEELNRALDEAGVGLETTSDFGINDGLFIRINIACPSVTLDKGLAALLEALKKLA